MSDNSEQLTQSNRKASDLETRRRLLKASAAAPLVATLTPTSAFAMSSATQCADPKANPSGAVAKQNNADKWTRTTVNCLVKKSGYGRKPGPNKLYQIQGEWRDTSGQLWRQGGGSGRRFKMRHYSMTQEKVLDYFDVERDPVIHKSSWPKHQTSNFPRKTPLTASCYASLTTGAIVGKLP